MKKYRKDIIYILIICILLVGRFVTHQKIDDYDKQSLFRNSLVGKFEYVEEKDLGYIDLNGIAYELTWYIDALDLKESNESFNEEWDYRILLNWSEGSPIDDDIEILIGENSMSIQGKRYELKKEEASFDTVYSIIEYKYHHLKEQYECFKKVG